MSKRVGNIYEMICDIDNIKEAHHQARKDKSFYDAVKKTDINLDERADEISKMLKNHSYKVSPYRTSIIYDRGKKRVLFKLPYYPDRIVQWAIMLQIEKSFLQLFTDFTCASIPNRGIHQASKMLMDYLRIYPEETKYCLKLDIKKFYPSINRNILKKLLQKKFKDKDLLIELNKIVDSMDNADISHLSLSPEEAQLYRQPGHGLPVGSYLSQYLANFYLAYFDHWLKETLKCKFVIRYMDDIVILSNSKEFLHNVLDEMKKYLAINLDLQIKENYQVFPVDSRGIDFIGFKHFHTYKILRKTTRVRFKKQINIMYKNDVVTNEKIWYEFVSMRGWISCCNSKRFAELYLVPLIPRMNVFYILHKRSSKKYRKQRFMMEDFFDKKFEKWFKHYNFIPSKRCLVHQGGLLC